ncbi:hypothetical protein [Gloeocapsa sp. PCC 73106]|uniref:hypothetical protein n=1 Tax=Gloeocapsa sp. PCC 73106 TaxID=102232 RepID=UPI0002ABA214|nr:hypothetical protein [Gloeocapsa sp. PCC 73106]ELR99089.1 hypothetical protein GLO73106DRAFT_00029350 [Gloeocapsa sp. PCC 73106]
MSMFKRLSSKLQGSKQLLQGLIEQYLIFNSEIRAVTLRKKMVLLLCKLAESRIEQITSLVPGADEGLIATIEHKGIKARIHFTPEKITLTEDTVKGELRLLNPPQFESDSLVYSYLIAGWQMFLGGKVPNGVLPKGVKLENNKIFYTLPRNELKVLEALFSTLENGSTLHTSIEQGDLTIVSSVILHENQFNLQSLLQVLNLKFV